ncbi:MAG: molybdenum cofactor biosynthesis protein MoaE [Pseudoxanthomonas suwonensis]|nr:molybdenum cofactor biosynthesis protein MoaE [Pseudoxanthomonas suwonensis]
MSAPVFRIAESSIDADALHARLQHPQAGACLVFEGRVRNHNEGRAVDGLRYEAYVELAEREGRAILEQAQEKFGLLALVCEHRIGSLAIGDLAVWVGVASAHRDAAFPACRWIIDEVKARVPIWKHERYAQGDAGWLHPEEGAGGREPKS